MWFPKRLVTVNEFNHSAAAGDYSALRLFKVIFRDINWEDIITKQQQSSSMSSVLSSKVTIGSVIDMVRAQSITLSQFYEKFVIS